MKSVFSRSAVVAAIGVAAALGQSNLGSIQGTVVGSDGTPLPGARVYAAIKAPKQPAKAPPTLVTYVVNGATAQSDGKKPVASPINSFVIPKLPAGAYILCAQPTVAGWLDPCHWSANVPAINLAAGQNLTGQTVVLTKGAIVQVRINDPSKLLPTQPGAIPQDVEVVALASNNAWYNARIASTDPGGRSQQLTLPFSATHTLIVRSKQFTLVDSTGAALPATGHTQPLQISAAAAAPQFTYTVSGKSR